MWVGEFWSGQIYYGQEIVQSKFEYSLCKMAKWWYYGKVSTFLLSLYEELVGQITYDVSQMSHRVKLI